MRQWLQIGYKFSGADATLQKHEGLTYGHNTQNKRQKGRELSDHHLTWF